MSLATFEGVVEQGQIKLKNGTALPDKIKVYVVVPDEDANENGSAAAKVYQYLDRRPEKKSQELFVRGAGVRASTIWHDRFISRFSPEQIARDRDLPLEAVYEALDYCQENWESICNEKDSEQQRLEKKGFFEESAPVHQ
ncbi:MAG: hypothetical protein JMDDDDMK_00643 [Acidobacteria bacterium]|nr:hypothetical protein [Acidobacteriota bacterium]